MKSKVDEDAKEKTFDFKDEGVGSGEKSVMHEMFTVRRALPWPPNKHFYK